MNWIYSLDRWELHSVYLDVLPYPLHSLDYWCPILSVNSVCTQHSPVTHFHTLMYSHPHYLRLYVPPHCPHSSSLTPLQIVEIVEEEEEGWWRGRVDGKEGLFPINFVEILESDAGNKGEGTGFNVPDCMNPVTLYITLQVNLAGSVEYNEARRMWNDIINSNCVW